MKAVDDKVKRGAKAKSLLGDPILKQALEDMREACCHNIETSHHESGKEREDLYYMMRCISKFKEILEMYIDEGKEAEGIKTLNIKQLKR